MKTYPVMMNGKQVKVTVPEDKPTMDCVISPEDFEIEEMGGGIVLASRLRDDGKYVVIGADMVCLYASQGAFDDGELALECIDLY